MPVAVYLASPHGWPLAWCGWYRAGALSGICHHTHLDAAEAQAGHILGPLNHRYPPPIVPSVDHLTHNRPGLQ
jgi:hypothetical protein